MHLDRSNARPQNKLNRLTRNYANIFFFSDHGSMKLKINYRKEMDKHTNVESKQHAPKNYGSMKKLKKKTESSQDK